MIEKPTILITSIGRTGTEFFAQLFADLIPDSSSVHEPDIVKSTGVGNRLEHYIKQLRTAGIWRMIFLKAFGKWTLVRLSDARFLGRMQYDQAASSLCDQRNEFINGMPGSFYIEANLGYYGLLDITPRVFGQHRAIYIVRDGREWVRSHVNWGQAYGKRGVRKLISHNWPRASDLPHDPYAEKWHRLSRFEQLCWAWSRLNEYALNTMPKNPHARLFHFEKIFRGQERYQVLKDLLGFVTSFPGLETERLGSTDGWLEQKIHQSSNEFPPWEGWSADQKYQFEEICGPLMERLGYHF